MPRHVHSSIYDILGRRAVHPFPARMAPELVSTFVRKSNRQLRVLDPTMGSGTVLALARRNNHRAFGIDIDPLAALIARVWTTAVDCKSVKRHCTLVLARAETILGELKAPNAFPKGADKATREFIKYWFDSKARKELYALSSAISGVRNSRVRDVLWCAFSRLIIAKQSGASLALDLAHSRPHKYFEKAPALPLRKFASSVDYVLENAIDQSATKKGPAAKAIEGDARSIKLKDNSIDLVITSPPYLNAIDYIRCSKFSLVWMGWSISQLSDVRRRSIGTEVGRSLKQDVTLRRVISALQISKLGERKIRVISAYIDDMRRAISEVARVLVPGGKAVYVVGENSINGRFVRNAKAVTLLAKSVGLSLKKETRRKLPPNRRYMPPPTAQGGAAMDSRMRIEVVLQFSKPKQKRRA